MGEAGKNKIDIFLPLNRNADHLAGSSESGNQKSAGDRNHDPVPLLHHAKLFVANSSGTHFQC
jgi:hypothetical protein